MPTKGQYNPHNHSRKIHVHYIPYIFIYQTVRTCRLNSNRIGSIGCRKIRNYFLQDWSCLFLPVNRERHRKRPIILTLVQLNTTASSWLSVRLLTASYLTSQNSTSHYNVCKSKIREHNIVQLSLGHQKTSNALTYFF